MFATIARAFRPLDTTEVDAAMAEAAAAHRQVRVRARALRMDVSCGDPIEAVRRIVSFKLSDDFFRCCFGTPQPTPHDLQDLLDKL